MFQVFPVPNWPVNNWPAVARSAAPQADIPIAAATVSFFNLFVTPANAATQPL
jgi:hypothetical protein